MQRFRLTGVRLGAFAVLLCVLVAASSGNDPLLDRQYHLRRVRAPEAWDVGRGRGQVIAVLDTGVDTEHPDLQGRFVRGIDLVDPGTAPRDPNGHGTFVAGIAAANLNNGKGGSGVSPRAKIMAVRVLDGDGEGTSDVVADGIRWATRRGATVINLSLADVPGQTLPATGLITNDVEQAIREAANAGVVVVGAAGNEGEEETPYSADLPALIVGATDKDDYVWEKSSYDDLTLFAPGVEIISTYVGTPYAAADGTSFSAPIVSAGAALLLQDGLTAEQARKRLRRTARPVGEGVGRVDVAAALGVAPQVRSTPSPEPAQEQSEESAEEPEKRKPRPVEEPSPVAADPPKQDGGGNDNEPEPVKEPTDKPRDVAAAEPPKQRKPKGKKQAVEQPTAADDGRVVAAPDVPPTPGSRPMWPVIVAGALLFLVTVSLGGYFAAKHSGG